MFSLTIKSIRANKARFLLTGVAVMLGVAFMAGTLVLTDTIKQSYDNVAANVYKSTDAVVRSAEHVEGRRRRATRGHDRRRRRSPRSARAPGVQAAEPQQLGVAVVVGHDGALLDANREPVDPDRAGVAERRPRSTRWSSSPVTRRVPPTRSSSTARRRRRATSRSARRCTSSSQVGSREYRLAGVATYGGADSAAGAQVVAFTPETAAEVLGTPGRYTAIQVVAAPGVSQHAARRRTSAPALHEPGHRGDHRCRGDRARPRKATGASLQFVNMFLMTFAIVALVVGSFVIYNTFSITVAQRTKETALLRAIGAKRKQVHAFGDARGAVHRRVRLGDRRGRRHRARRRVCGSVLDGVRPRAAGRRHGRRTRARSSSRWSPASS